MMIMMKIISPSLNPKLDLVPETPVREYDKPHRVTLEASFPQFFSTP